VGDRQIIDLGCHGRGHVSCFLRGPHSRSAGRGAAAELAALRKSTKYADLDQTHVFQPSSGLREFGHHIKRVLLRLYPQYWQRNLTTQASFSAAFGHNPPVLSSSNAILLNDTFLRRTDSKLLAYVFSPYNL